MSETIADYDYKGIPDKDYCWFAEADEKLYFQTEAEAVRFANDATDGYIDEGWDSAVRDIQVGKITHTCEQANRTNRPDETELDEEGLDKEGQYWGDFLYRCDYKMKPVSLNNEEGDW